LKLKFLALENMVRLLEYDI